MADVRAQARDLLTTNFEKTGGQYIPPNLPHYPAQWLWDSCFHSIACSELGLDDLAKNEIRTLLASQDERGWIPHLLYHGKYRWYDWERFLYGKGLRPPSSSIVGPPVLAQAVEQVGDDAFSSEVIEQLVRFYRYFWEYRGAKESGLVSIITPRESRDSAPEFDFFRGRPPHPFKFLDTVLDAAFLALLEARYFVLGWKEERILDAGMFNVKDLMVHCIWVDGLYSLRTLLENTKRSDLFPDIDEVIKRGESAVVEQAWDEESKCFYPIRTGRGQIQEISIGSLFPLLLENMPERMESAMMELLLDPKHFWTEYPVPSVSVSHPEFNPTRTWPLWRGPTWMNTNWFLIRALVRKGYADAARTIAERSMVMAEKYGFREFYHPFDGTGLRVRNFGWSTLVVTFPKLVAVPDQAFRPVEEGYGEQEQVVQ